MDSLDQLRRQRVQASSARDHERLRAQYGQRLADAVAQTTGKPLSLESFGREEGLTPVDWPADIRDASGLVAAYIGRRGAERLLACVRNALGMLDGRIGFHEKPYMGFANVQEVEPLCLLAAAEAVEDTILFYSTSPAGILMVDCYISQPGEPFSIVVQGGDLSQRLAPCFGVGCSVGEC